MEIRKNYTKRVFYYLAKKLLILKSENPIYEDFIFTGEKLNQMYILVKAIAFQSNVKWKIYLKT